MVLSESLEDYLESIYQIIIQKNGVRVKDIAARMKIKNSSVTAALKVLANEGYINYEPYGIISLTKQGNKLAKKITERHRFLKLFFANTLGVNPETAETTACKIEHIFDEETFKRFTLFIKFITDNFSNNKEFNKQFIEYCKKEEIQDKCPEYIENIINEIYK